jgi:hypothetical protein
MGFNRGFLPATVAVMVVAMMSVGPVGSVVPVVPVVPTTPEAERPRGGVVRTCGRALCDDGGPWPALGASMFWAMWGFKFDRARLEGNLKFLAEHDFDYIRVLGELGGSHWKDRPVDPRWPDYDRIVAELTDLAYQKYGLRVEWTLFGGTDFSTTPALRQERVDRFARAMVGREQAVLLVEIANEGWQNGFPHPSGTTEMRALAARLGAKLTEAGAKPLLRAVTSPAGPEVYGTQDRRVPYRVTYEGAGVDVGTVHSTRDRGDNGWRPLRALIEYRQAPGMPMVISNDEPIGPGSSGNAENDPLKLVSQAIASYMVGLAAYTYHTNAGIWGGGASGQHRGPGDVWSLPRARDIAGGFKATRAYVPPDVANWTFHDTNATGHPFQSASPLFAAVQGTRFVALPFNVQGKLPVKATRPMTVTMIHPLTGATLRTVSLTAGQSFMLPTDLSAVFLSGSFK